MDNKNERLAHDAGQITRTSNILRRQGITSRAIFWERFDKSVTRKQLELIDGVGLVRADLLHWLLSLDDVAWAALTGLGA